MSFWLRSGFFLKLYTPKGKRRKRSGKSENRRFRNFELRFLRFFCVVARFFVVDLTIRFSGAKKGGGMRLAILQK